HWGHEDSPPRQPGTSSFAGGYPHGPPGGHQEPTQRALWVTPPESLVLRVLLRTTLVWKAMGRSVRDEGGPAPPRRRRRVYDNPQRLIQTPGPRSTDGVPLGPVFGSHDFAPVGPALGRNNLGGRGDQANENRSTDNRVREDGVPVFGR